MITSPLLISLALFAASPAGPPAAASPEAAVAAVAALLDDWHDAAAKADEARYFSRFAPDGVFLGTDGTERWTTAAFRAWAKPYFDRGKAWSFRAISRHVAFSKDGGVAWFDEALETPNMGPCRGSGVLVRESGAWRIAQYNLTLVVPNDVMKDVKKLIDGAAKPAPASGK